MTGSNAMARGASLDRIGDYLSAQLEKIWTSQLATQGWSVSLVLSLYWFPSGINRNATLDLKPVHTTDDGVRSYLLRTSGAPDALLELGQDENLADKLRDVIAAMHGEHATGDGNVHVRFDVQTHCLGGFVWPGYALVDALGAGPGWHEEQLAAAGH